MSELEQFAYKIGKLLLEHHSLLTTAESCTGGWLSQVMTANAGSSQWFDCGFVTYSNEAKQQLLQVKPCLLEQYGAVSVEVASAMAQGALHRSRAQIAIAITGIAGPEGGSALKPVGTVCFACVTKSGLTESNQQCFSGDRYQIRKAAVEFALNMLQKTLISF